MSIAHASLESTDCQGIVELAEGDKKHKCNQCGREFDLKAAEDVQCCEPGCGKPAEFKLSSNQQAENVTFSCEDHVGRLLGAVPQVTSKTVKATSWYIEEIPR